jgi:aryl-alcohol dehydrogenase-like predicted oxidoreductase
VARGIDEALRRLGTDYLDVALLHSCGADILSQGECTQALLDAKAAGKVVSIGYSGDGPPLLQALHSRRFDVLECSVNVCDQRVFDEVLPHAAAAGVPIIAKRALANAPWRYATCPAGIYVEEYWWRYTTMAPTEDGLLAGMDPATVALRYSAFAPGVHTALVGTTQIANLHAAARAIAQGPLPDDLVRAWRRRFAACDPGWWVGQV